MQAPNYQKACRLYEQSEKRLRQVVLEAAADKMEEDEQKRATDDLLVCLADYAQLHQNHADKVSR